MTIIFFGPKFFLQTKKFADKNYFQAKNFLDQKLTNFQHPFSIFSQISNLGYESDQFKDQFLGNCLNQDKKLRKTSQREVVLELEDLQSFC